MRRLEVAHLYIGEKRLAKSGRGGGGGKGGLVFLRRDGVWSISGSSREKERGIRVELVAKAPRERGGGAAPEAYDNIFKLKLGYHKRIFAEVSKEGKNRANRGPSS